MIIEGREKLEGDTVKWKSWHGVAEGVGWKNVEMVERDADSTEEILRKIYLGRYREVWGSVE